MDHLLRPADKTPEPPHGVVARQLRVELRLYGDTGQHDTGRSAWIVVTEIIQAAKGPR